MSAMRVVIEARALHSSTTAGVKTYASELIRSLREIGGADYEVIQDNPPAWKLPWWMNVTLAFDVAQAKPDVIHFTKAAVPWRKLAPTVVTIHDIIPIMFPESQAGLRRWLWPRALRQAALKSDHIIAVSGTTKRDIVQQFGVPSEKITVIPEGVDLDRFRPAPTPGESRMRGTLAGEVASPYILFVGTRDIRKNVPLLIRAFARIAEDIPHRLVIAGRQALKRGDDRRQAQELGLEKRITWLDFVSEHDLPALYAGADLFVWPSAYEGWGLPAMEAMASGVPVIVSNGGALPEVVGSPSMRGAGAAEIVPFTEEKLQRRMWDMPFEEALAARMLAVLEDENKQRAMRTMGLERVRQFSWRRVAEQTLAVYRKVIRNE